MTGPAPNALRLPVGLLAASLGLFLAVSYLLCILLGLVLPGWGLHRPWMQFFVGFTWLTWPSFLSGLVQSFLYGAYAGLMFGLIFNALARRPAARPQS
mgnify:CR=1 FL=1